MECGELINLWLVGFGDMIQAIGESLGAITTPSLYVAQSMNAGVLEWNVHSQGGSIFAGAFSLVSNQVLSEISVRTSGSQIFISPTWYGLNSADNEVRSWDFIPGLDPFNLLRMATAPGTLRILNPIPGHYGLGAHNYGGNYRIDPGPIP